ncbi:response regulator transcription factor [Actinoplanes couchii]|uniref:DNA-binding response regulator n=1 Tax=Actinoplanes couchii TaxID=403638 RepID=A0ABQ3XEV1_9ACTN|nr:response regulator transcription factor [Actinoplanes couchii]MDR6319820.1 DNA-binding NarL/FixJ family response regulator [Actinoplanes couchii]GID56955.1 DNA-binding response regulator [Actinoplanes couchii]
MTRVLIVDDQDDIRAGIRAMLLLDPALEVVGDLSDGLQAVPFLREHQVDLVLMDIRMPGIDGVEATRRIRAEHPPALVRIIVLTTFDQDDIVLAALRAGANGFLSKTVSPAELVAGITEVVAGGGALSANASAALIGHMADSRTPVVDRELLRRFDVLTPREREMVVLVARGFSNEEIAAQMFVSPLTVKTHVVRAMTKVGARDRAQLVSFSFRAGL